MVSIVSPISKIWEGASTWVPVCEVIESISSRNPSVFREVIGSMDIAGVPGYTGIPLQMVCVRSIIIVSFP
ncbi:hypothetical protein SDC9_189379 [bioreactor metagenome]|uniref:Uncharacterized protein n=1 Tax=bioreactor metagenome TaxID=1076179 RepID=A0A645I078_9ZZZZ